MEVDGVDSGSGWEWVVGSKFGWIVEVDKVDGGSGWGG